MAKLSKAVATKTQFSIGVMPFAFTIRTLSNTLQTYSEIHMMFTEKSTAVILPVHPGIPDAVEATATLPDAELNLLVTIGPVADPRNSIANFAPVVILSKCITQCYLLYRIPLEVLRSE
jgi:hypothetical protein